MILSDFVTPNYLNQKSSSEMTINYCMRNNMLHKRQDDKSLNSVKQLRKQISLGYIHSQVTSHFRPSPAKSAHFEWNQKTPILLHKEEKSNMYMTSQIRNVTHSQVDHKKDIFIEPQPAA